MCRHTFPVADGIDWDDANKSGQEPPSSKRHGFDLFRNQDVLGLLVPDVCIIAFLTS